MNKRLKGLGLVFGVILALGDSAFAGTICVPTDYPTIQAAIDAAQAGDQVLVASGTYYEHVTMKSQVDLLGGYESTGWTRDIDNNPTVIDGSGTGDIVTMNTGGYATFDGFVVRNGDCGFKVPGTPSVWELVISNNEFIGAGIHIEILGSCTIKNNVIHDVTADGWGAFGALSFRQPRDLSIINNIIYNNYNGCYTWHEVGTIKYINNTIVNSGTAIKMQMDTSHIIANNIIVNNDNGIENNHIAGYTITYNNLWSNGTDYVSCAPGTGNISADPVFSDSGSHNYHLQKNSPCIDAGANDAPELPGADADNNSRVIDGNGDQVAVVDIGAYEFQGTPPTADAGPDQTVDEGATVTLNGSNSSDPDDGIASYQWTQTAGTTVTLSDATAVQPTFTSPNVGPGGVALTFELTVTDNGSLQATDTCIVNVTWINISPTADAGSEQTVDEGVQVILNASNSSDPDDGIASYQWTQPAGTSITLSDSASDQPTFTAPDVGPDGESLTFQLTVTDNDGLSATDSVVISVSNVNATPVASDQSISTDENTAVSITLTGSDTDGDDLTYSVIDQPSHDPIWHSTEHDLHTQCWLYRNR